MVKWGVHSLLWTERFDVDPESVAKIANFYDPIVTTGELLCYMHCCENDRGIAGTGNVDWDGVFKALSDIRYDKWITLESFTPEIKSVAASTAIWRQVAPSADAIGSEGLRFLKSMWKKYA